MHNVTRVASTEDEYRQRAINLSIKAYNEAKAANINLSKVTTKVVKSGEEVEAMHILATAKWAKAKWVGNVNPKTWRKYRCSFRFYAQELLFEGKVSSAMCDAIEDEMANKSELNQREIKNTSAKKKKHFGAGDLEKIIRKLMSLRAKNAKPLSNWLFVNQLVGLRPIEWETASIKKGSKGLVLLVQNAKNTNKRSHGKHREIQLHNFEEKQQKAIVAFTSLCGKLNERGDFDSFYEDCRKLLQRTCKKLWPKRTQQITLYTTRHQFSADLKMSGKSLVEIAYLMGHISTDTAMSHYGKKRYGRSKVTPEVDPELAKSIKSDFVRFTFTSNKNKAA
ncbi:site-specific integrase [Vibrio crassostreae]|uniref:site-specific integrase n=1 Tax=Vibrio crassostreae TaxID=246167 RepID=UPI001B3065BE|nr:site-specific integrase [Vibrio crassostreae]